MIKNDYGLVEEREAKELSLELMNERTAVMNEADKDYDNFWFARVFNLCEH